MKIGPVVLPVGFVTVTSKLLSLSVEAVSSVEWKHVYTFPFASGPVLHPTDHGPAPTSSVWTFDGAIEGYITVSNADGSPRTDLVPANFSIDLVPSIPTTHTISPVSSRPGAYGFVINPAAPLTDPNAWQKGVYYIFVAVSKLLSSFPAAYREYGKGLAVTSAQVSFEQPSEQPSEQPPP